MNEELENKIQELEKEIKGLTQEIRDFEELIKAGLDKIYDIARELL